MALPLKLPFSRAATPVSKARVFYSQPSRAQTDLMPLYQKLAKDIDVTPAAVRAFAVVESDERPFSPNGCPIVRFEAHHWVKRRIATRDAVVFDRAKNPSDLDARWDQFMRMRAVNEIAAIQSHSFGLWQTMGFNYRLCMCADPVSFLAEMMTVDGQFKMFKRFMLSSPALLSAVRRNDAEAVGFHYNGPQYKKVKYHLNWAAAAKAGGVLVWA